MEFIKVKRLCSITADRAEKSLCFFVAFYKFLFAHFCCDVFLMQILRILGNIFTPSISAGEQKGTFSALTADIATVTLKSNKETQTFSIVSHLLSVAICTFPFGVVDNKYSTSIAHS